MDSLELYNSLKAENIRHNKAVKGLEDEYIKHNSSLEIGDIILQYGEKYKIVRIELICMGFQKYDSPTITYRGIKILKSGKYSKRYPCGIYICDGNYTLIEKAAPKQEQPNQTDLKG